MRLFYTILYYSIPFLNIETAIRQRIRQRGGSDAGSGGIYTILYYSILFNTILYYSILFYTILYYSVLFYTGSGSGSGGGSGSPGLKDSFWVTTSVRGRRNRAIRRLCKR